MRLIDRPQIDSLRYMNRLGYSLAQLVPIQTDTGQLDVSFCATRTDVVGAAVDRRLFLRQLVEGGN